ncbi:gamma-glutamylcyclotransferase family protein [Marinobacterium arenosum]|uniref:gamma-glutamylcyclotransferase family protein n=1 Tax=Marinobacterium arenosum TaxID=2862496 RepID=UPI001C979814|nr:gamma-glutamylcyclotransferase family protein [Marinobacterium arenosum]MBY4678947.1 gamma-glutamylcyclotransferase [Marinobacterium arenosum]
MAKAVPSLLFAYGTLQVESIMTEVIGRPLSTGQPAVLSGYRCRRVRNAAYPAVVRDPSERTAGILYQGVDAEALIRLDDYEGAIYQRLLLEVVTDDGKQHTAWVYCLVDHSHGLLSNTPWNLERFIAEDLPDYRLD